MAAGIRRRREEEQVGERLGRIRHRGPAGPETQLTGRDVKAGTAPYQQFRRGLAARPAPTGQRLAARAWSAPGAAPQAAPEVTPELPSTAERLSALMGEVARDVPGARARLVELYAGQGPRGFRTAREILSRIAKQRHETKEAEAERGGAIAQIRARGEEARKTAGAAEDFAAQDREDRQEHDRAMVRLEADAKREGKLAPAQEAQLKTVGESRKYTRGRLEAAEKRISNIDQTLITIYDHVGMAPVEEIQEGYLAETPDTDYEDMTKTEYYSRLRSAKQRDRLLQERRNLMSSREELQQNYDALSTREMDILQPPEAEEAGVEPTGVQPEEAPTTQPAEPTGELKPLTANIVAEAKRKFPDDEEAAAAWLASQGYKLE